MALPQSYKIPRAATYALHVPADSRLSSDLNIPDAPIIAQPHAGTTKAWDVPTSRISTQQDICSQYGTPFDPTKNSCVSPVCINTGVGFCGPYCEGTLTPCSGACPPNSITSCGPPPQGLLVQRCTPDTGACTIHAAATIAQNWPASIATAIIELIPEAETCITDLENNTPLHTCLASCGAAKTPVIQTVECGVGCVIQHGAVPNSCLSFLGDAILTVVAATSPQAAVVVMLVESIVCEIQICAT